MKVDPKRILESLRVARRGAHARGRRIGAGVDNRVWLIIGVLAAVVAGGAVMIVSLSGRGGTSKLLPPDPTAPDATPVSSSPAQPSTVPDPTGSAVPEPVAPDGAPAGAVPPRAKPSRTRDQAPTVPRTVSYEAEAGGNRLQGSAHDLRVASASGGTVVTDIGDGSANILRFNGVAVPAAGTYTLTVFYLTTDNLRLTVAVGGADGVSISVPGLPGSADIGTVAVAVTLAAGTNSVTISNKKGPAPDIDRITVEG